MSAANDGQLVEARHQPGPVPSGGFDARALVHDATLAPSSHNTQPWRFHVTDVAIDLIAMRPTQASSAKRIVEYDPPIVPIRFLTYEDVVVLSGVTTVLPTLDAQLANILPRISGSLADGGSSWDKVAKVSFYLHRSQTIDNLKELFRRHVNASIPQMEYCFVDGYSAEGKFCEVEVTAHT